MANDEEKTIEKNFSDESKATKILWVILTVVLIGIIAISTLLWRNIKRDQSESVAGAGESGSVLGTSTEDPVYLSTLADNLKQAGFVLYGSSQSEETKRQKEIFGQAFNSLDYVECDLGVEGSNPQECAARGISEFPTWILADQKYLGFQSISQLEELLDQKSK